MQADLTKQTLSSQLLQLPISLVHKAGEPHCRGQPTAAACSPCTGPGRRLALLMQGAWAGSCCQQAACALDALCIAWQMLPAVSLTLPLASCPLPACTILKG